MGTTRRLSIGTFPAAVALALLGPAAQSGEAMDCVRLAFEISSLTTALQAARSAQDTAAMFEITKLMAARRAQRKACEIDNLWPDLAAPTDEAGRKRTVHLAARLAAEEVADLRREQRTLRLILRANDPKEALEREIAELQARIDTLTPAPGPSAP